MEIYNINKNKKASINSDMIFYYSGYEECERGHSWGPGIRDHYIIHYVLDGEGIFRINDEEVSLGKNQGFLIKPNTIAYYQADQSNPWKYVWVAFNGFKTLQLLQKAGFNEENYTFTFEEDVDLRNCFEGMYNLDSMKKSSEVRSMSLLYEFFVLLIDNNKNTQICSEQKTMRDFYIEKTLDFIHMNYSRNIGVKDIARYIGIDRKYLHFIFKSYSGISPQGYLIGLRIEKACELLRDDDLSIMNVSNSVGYRDPLLFSKMFKKYKGVSPTEYKLNMQNNV